MKRGFQPLVAAWPTALREFAVIVAGVLVALGAQAWWERGQERERERDYLAQLWADTRENERRLRSSIEEERAATRASARIMRALLDPAAPLPGDSLRAWVSSAGSFAEFQPLSGTYSALLATGDLRLVRSDSLRARLVAYAPLVENELTRARQQQAAVMDLVPAMARALPFMRGVFSGAGMRLDEATVARFRADPEAANVLFALQALHVNRLGGLERAHEETVRLLRALEAESGTEQPIPAGPART